MTHTPHTPDVSEPRRLPLNLTASEQLASSSDWPHQPGSEAVSFRSKIQSKKQKMHMLAHEIDLFNVHLRSGIFQSDKQGSGSLL